ncbi:Ig-like domain-containing protein, partial [Roseovarius salinarum]|uniref:Ig-like domain-containing protein n=1 Tax=Roseovarius salinarum TaxID=1981892 RepID=UPI0018E4B57A
ALAALCIAGGAAAQESCPAPPPPAAPGCSVGAMLGAANPAQTLDVFGNLNPAAFAGGANADILPGQASMTISGGVSAGGAACARHLSAVREGGTGGVPGLDAGTADFLETMMDEEVDIPTAGGGTRRAVFEVFSPNIIAYQGGALGQPLSLRHGGVGGWPRNAGAHLVIALTDAGPGELEAGKTYGARAVGSDGDGDPADLYSAWTGQIRPRPYTPPDTADERRRQETRKQACRSLRRAFLDVMEQSGVPLDETLGRQVRETDCDMDGVGQAGTRTLAGGGSLSGTVTVERITDAAVIGRFDLSGTVPVEKERRTWSDRGPGRVDIATERGAENLTVSGRFAAPNTRNTGYTRPPLEVARAPESTAAEAPELRLVRHRPTRNEKNLPWDAPGIRLTFSRPLDPLTVTPAAVRLETGLAAGQGGTRMAAVETRVRLAGPDTVTVTPQEPLRDGVRYRLTVRADGLRGAEGARMAVDRVWGFETMVDLDDDQAVTAGLADHLEAVEGVESDTIQVATNADLVRGKPAVIRVYAKWAPDPEIAPAWQVRAFPAHVRARPAFRREAPLLVPEQRDVTIRRPDDYSDRERRAARNSVNLYGWTPEYEEVRSVRAEVEPARDCVGAPRVFSGNEDVAWDPLERDLKVGYVFARVGPWYDGVPGGMRAEGARAAARSETFMEQLFPVQSVKVTRAANPPPDPDFNEKVVAEIAKITQFEGLAEEYGDTTMAALKAFNDFLASPPAVTTPLKKRATVRYRVLKHMQEHLMATGAYDSYDLVVIYLPFEWIRLLGVKSHIYLGRRDGVDIYQAQPFIGMSLTQPGSGSPLISDLGTIAHEVGHAFGLEHRPWVLAGEPAKPTCLRHANTRWDGIEGMRLARDGEAGWNKSHADGNEEAGRELLPLMFPCAREKEKQFITRRNYDILLRNLKKDFSALSP